MGHAANLTKYLAATQNKYNLHVDSSGMYMDRYIVPIQFQHLIKSIQFVTSVIQVKRSMQLHFFATSA